jgi:hypothetical protein
MWAARSGFAWGPWRAMPYHFEFEAELKILLVVGEGDVQAHEIGEINDHIRAYVKRLNPVAGISDFSAVKSFHVPSQTLRAAALQPSPYPDETPRFIVAATDYLFGMARMYEIVANRPEGKLQVVRSREEALAALGVQNSKFERVE